MNRLRKPLTIIAATVIMMTIFQGLTLKFLAPIWLGDYCYLLGSIFIFFSGLVIGQEWEKMEKGFLALIRVVIYAIVLGILFSYLPTLYGVNFSQDSLMTFLIGRGFVAALLWSALGLVGVFVGTGTRV